MVKAKTEKNPRGAGRQRKEIDFRQFEELCKIQCTEQEICAVLGVGTDTLVARLKEEYGMNFAEIRQQYKEFGKASIRRIQMNLATKSPAMAIWLGKQYLGQTENTNVSFENADEHFKEIADAISKSDTYPNRLLQ